MPQPEVASGSTCSAERPEVNRKFANPPESPSAGPAGSAGPARDAVTASAKPAPESEKPGSPNPVLGSPNPARGSGKPAPGSARPACGSAKPAPGMPAVRTRTKPSPGTTPARRSDSGSAWTGRPTAPPIASRSNVPGTIRSTQVRACSPDISRVAPPSVIVHHTAPRRNMITPSRIGATIPNAGASPDMWPMTQAARRLAIALADAWRSEPTSAASSSNS